MTYEELEILIKNRRTSDRRAELVRAIPSEKEEAKGNDDITQPHSSNPHNKLIANMLYSTSYIERWGLGNIKTIRVNMMQHLLYLPHLIG